MPDTTVGACFLADLNSAPYLVLGGRVMMRMACILRVSLFPSFCSTSKDCHSGLELLVAWLSNMLDEFICVCLPIGKSAFSGPLILSTACQDRQPHTRGLNPLK